MWWPMSPWGLIYYTGRALESRPEFFLVAAVVIVGVLAWKKPPRFRSAN